MPTASGGLDVVLAHGDTAGKPEVEADLVAAMDLLAADTMQQCLDRGELGWSRRGRTLDKKWSTEIGALLVEPPRLLDGTCTLVDPTGLCTRICRSWPGLAECLPRGIRPTEAGAALLDEARQVVAKVDGLRAVVGRAARGEQGRLAIGFTGSAALHPLVPRALRQFRMTFPAVSVTLEEATAQELLEVLLRERIDAAFVRSDIAGMPEVRMESILDEPMLAALPPGHPLARDDGQPLPLACLAAESFVLYHRPTRRAFMIPSLWPAARRGSIRSLCRRRRDCRRRSASSRRASASPWCLHPYGTKHRGW